MQTETSWHQSFARTLFSVFSQCACRDAGRKQTQTGSGFGWIMFAWVISSCLAWQACFLNEIFLLFGRVLLFFWHLCASILHRSNHFLTFLPQFTTPCLLCACLYACVCVCLWVCMWRGETDEVTVSTSWHFLCWHWSCFNYTESLSCSPTLSHIHICSTSLCAHSR